MSMFIVYEINSVFSCYVYNAHIVSLCTYVTLNDDEPQLSHTPPQLAIRSVSGIIDSCLFGDKDVCFSYSFRLKEGENVCVWLESLTLMGTHFLFLYFYHTGFFLFYPVVVAITVLPLGVACSTSPRFCCWKKIFCTSLRTLPLPNFQLCTLVLDSFLALSDSSMLLSSPLLRSLYCYHVSPFSSRVGRSRVSLILCSSFHSCLVPFLGPSPAGLWGSWSDETRLAVYSSFGQMIVMFIFLNVLLTKCFKGILKLTKI